jgi:hypothetical protein
MMSQANYKIQKLEKENQDLQSKLSTCQTQYQALQNSTMHGSTTHGSTTHGSTMDETTTDGTTTDSNKRKRTHQDFWVSSGQSFPVQAPKNTNLTKQKPKQKTKSNSTIASQQSAQTPFSFTVPLLTSTDTYNSSDMKGDDNKDTNTVINTNQDTPIDTSNISSDMNINI